MVEYWMPSAAHKPVVKKRPLARKLFSRENRRRTDGVVLHVAASEAPSLYGYFANPRTMADSTFYVLRDGTIEQYLPLGKRDWASNRGSLRMFSVETQGMAYGPWTDAQIASLAEIIRWARTIYDFPLRLMASSKTREKGIGYHLLGVPATRTQKALGISQTGGELWSSAPGKVCPGPDRVKQVPLVIKAAAGGTYKPPAGAPVAHHAPQPPSPAKPAVTGSNSVHTIQARLKGLGFYKGVVDGVAGPMTKAAVVAYQRHQGYMPGLLIDGNWGPLTEAHYQWVRKLQTALNQWKTAGRMGEVSVDGDLGPYTMRLVMQTQKDNALGAYRAACKKIYGAKSEPAIDGKPGRVFCKMLGIPHHPCD
ncbi:peptidoglycan recognition protein family protein [Arcanobacterium canis]